MIKIKLLAACAALIALPALAIPQAPGTDRRQANQMEAKEAKAKPDGKVTAPERKKLQKAKKSTSRKMARHSQDRRNIPTK